MLPLANMEITDKAGDFINAIVPVMQKAADLLQEINAS